MNSQRLWLGRAGRENSRFRPAIFGFCLAFASTSFQVFGEDTPQIPNAARPTRVRVSAEWHIEIIPRTSPLPSEPRRLDVVARNEADDKLVPVPADSRSKSDAREQTVEAGRCVCDRASQCVCCCANQKDPVRPIFTPAEYREFYNSIPFNRTEYLANRDYRHEATMELLMGQLRPKTVVKFERPSTDVRFSSSFQTLGPRNGVPYFSPSWSGHASPSFWTW